MSNQEVLNELVNEQEQAVFKTMRSDMNTGKALLNPEQAGTFLGYAVLNSTLLKDSNFVPMQSFKKQLPRVNISGRVLTSGYDANGVTRDVSSDKATLNFGYNELDAAKLKAMCELSDDDKEDNIEQAQFENTLLRMMGERIGEDLEYWQIFADKDVTYATNKLLNTTDGVVKTTTADNKLISSDVATATSGTADFNPDNGIEEILDAMIAQMPPRFRNNRSNLKFYVTFEMEDAYRNLLKERGTPLGDSTQVGFNSLAYKSIPLVHCNTLDAADAYSIDSTYKAILANPKNINYGIWKNITVEPKRIVETETTQYFYRLRGDVKQNFNEATVIASISQAENEALPEVSAP